MRTSGDLMHVTRAMLAGMLARGPLTTDEVDPNVNKRTMSNRLERLRGMGYLSSVKKPGVNICVWTVTERGRMATVNAPTPGNVAQPRSYAPAGEWHQQWMPIRSGSMAAFEVPSVGLPT